MHEKLKNSVLFTELCRSERVCTVDITNIFYRGVRLQTQLIRRKTRPLLTLHEVLCPFNICVFCLFLYWEQRNVNLRILLGHFSCWRPIVFFVIKLLSIDLQVDHVFTIRIMALAAIEVDTVVVAYWQIFVSMQLTGHEIIIKQWKLQCSSLTMPVIHCSYHTWIHLIYTMLHICFPFNFICAPRCAPGTIDNNPNEPEIHIFCLNF